MPASNPPSILRGVPRVAMIATLGPGIIVVLMILTYQATRATTDEAPPEPSEASANTLEPDDPLDQLRTKLAALGERLQRLEQAGGQGRRERRELQQAVAAIERRLSEHNEQQAVLASDQDSLDQRQSQLQTTLAQIESTRDPDAAARQAQSLADLEEALVQLRAEHQQRLYRVNAMDARLRQQAQILETLRMRVAALPAGGPGPTALAPPPDTLPFTVTAIDRWQGADTITVVEPALLGRRHTVFLREGDSHLGWTVTAIDGRRVTFTHRSGKQLTARVAG